jgi:hypothetical protein
MCLKYYWLFVFFFPFCLLARNSHSYSYESTSYIPVSSTTSDVLVGTLQRHRTSWLSQSRRNERYWLSDAQCHPIIELDFSSCPIPRDGINIWVRQHVSIRGETISRGRRPALFRVAFIQKEEGSPSAAQELSARNSGPQPICKRLSTTSSSRH